MRIMFFLTAAWLLATPSVALGNRFAITSGSGHISWPAGAGSPPQFGSGQFALFGPSISFTAVGVKRYPPCTWDTTWEWCTPGSTIDVEDGLESEDIESGTVTIDGIETDIDRSLGEPSAGVILSFSLAPGSLK